MMTPSKTLLSLLALLTALAVACSSDTTSPKDLAGLYSLSDVDDVLLPATVDSTADTVKTVTVGSLSVDPNGFYTLVVGWQTIPTGEAAVPGAYSQMGTLVVTGDSQFTLQGDDDQDWIGVVETNALRIAVLIPALSATSVELRFRL